MNGALGFDLRENDARRKKAMNSMALATSTLARQRNPKLSALSYSVNSAILNYKTVDQISPFNTIDFDQ